MVTWPSLIIIGNVGQIETFFKSVKQNLKTKNLLWHFPKCRLNSVLDCLDRLFGAYLVNIQKHHKYRHVGIDPACSNHVNGAA